MMLEIILCVLLLGLIWAVTVVGDSIKKSIDEQTRIMAINHNKLIIADMRLAEERRA